MNSHRMAGIPFNKDTTLCVLLRFGRVRHTCKELRIGPIAECEAIAAISLAACTCQLLEDARFQQGLAGPVQGRQMRSNLAYRRN